jgi:Chemotaxis response regulator containing a CheY-like receiver domain and a methylesterase domain
VKVLVIEDSPFIRGVIRNVLGKLGIEILSAGNLREGMEGIRENPDFVILDINLPDGSGFEILRIYPPERVIVFSSDRSAVLRALEMGVLDSIPKPSSPEDLRKVVEIFRGILKGKERVEEVFLPEVVLVGASSGSPKSIIEIFADRKPKAPIIICLHIHEQFAESFAQRIFAEVIYPGGKVISVGKYLLYPSKNFIFTSKNLIKDTEIESTFYPSVDLLFSSAAKFYGNRTLGIILSGMGKDGMEGSKEIKRMGGKVLAQDKKDAVVWGMPAAVKGIADAYLSNAEIILKLKEWGVFE